MKRPLDRETDRAHYLYGRVANLAEDLERELQEPACEAGTAAELRALLPHLQETRERLAEHLRVPLPGRQPRLSGLAR